MFGDMMGKLQEAQQKIEETKKRMDTVSVTGEAEGGLVKVVVTASRKVQDIIIDDSLLGEKEDLQDLIIVAMNKALSQAEQVFETEMAAVSKGIMPNIPGLG